MRVRMMDLRMSAMSSYLMVVGMVLLCAISRLLPHPPNFTPVAAIALFAGATLASTRIALLVPLLGMMLSDLVIGMHGLAMVVYGALALNVLLGRWLQGKPSVFGIAGASVAGATVFFLITNFGCWVQAGNLTIAALVKCYVAAIPFFGNTLAGDVTFTAIIFGTASAANWLAAGRRSQCVLSSPNGNAA